jgi:hypothetical protein
MALQTSFGVRLTIAGDGVTKDLRLDLTNTVFQMVGGEYGFIPRIPDSVLHVVIGGPSVSNQSQQNLDVVTELDGEFLTLHFSHALLENREHYTVELIFGCHGAPPKEPTPEPVVDPVE